MQKTIRHAALLGCVTMLASCSDSAPDQADLPYGTIQQMMADHVQPTADVYWSAVKFESILEDDGTITENDIRPDTEEDWLALQEAAVRIGEYGEAMLTPAYSEGRGEDWLDFSQGLIDVAERAEQAAIDQDPDAVFEVGGTVYNVCRACHQMYPPAEIPEGATVEDFRPSEDLTLEEYVEQDGT